MRLKFKPEPGQSDGSDSRQIPRGPGTLLLKTANSARTSDQMPDIKRLNIWYGTSGYKKNVNSDTIAYYYNPILCH